MTAAAIDANAIALKAFPSLELHQAGIRLDGGVPLDWGMYPYLPRIIDTNVKRMTVLKGAQMGMTIAAILKALALAKRGQVNGIPLRGIAYWFPTSGEAQIFAKARFTPLMDQNQHMWPPDQMDVDSAELKRIGRVAIYLRGAGQRGGAVAKSTSGVKSIPLDINIRDERDEMDDSRVDAIDHRLDGSDIAMTLDFSTPTLPGHGVDLAYQSSDQSSWLWVCPKCTADVCLEDDYPNCIAEPRNADPFYLCSGCRDPLVKEFGRWVARKPELTSEHVGLSISQLSSKRRTALDVVKESLKAAESGRRREFENQVLGRAYAEVDDQITEEQLTDLVMSDETRPLHHEGPCSMGVDPGKIHWYTVRVRISETDSFVIARGKADSYEELSRIAKRFNVESGVMDKGYDPSAVAKFCQDHKGWYGCRYVEAKISDPDWKHREKEVSVGRTWLLDSSHNDIVTKRVKYHQRDEFWYDEFIPQMTNLKRTTIENANTGTRRAMWVVTGGQKNDHLRHADAYCHLALTKCGIARSIQRMATRSRKQSGSSRKRTGMTL